MPQIENMYFALKVASAWCLVWKLLASVLIHYDETLPLFISFDASSYGASSCYPVVSDRWTLSTSGVDASCTLTQAQRSYSQLEKARHPHYLLLIKAISPVSVWSLFTIVTDQTDHFFSCLAQRTQILFMLQHGLRDGHWLYPCVTQLQD